MSLQTIAVVAGLLACGVGLFAGWVLWRLPVLRQAAAAERERFGGVEYLAGLRVDAVAMKRVRLMSTATGRPVEELAEELINYAYGQRGGNDGD